MNPVLEPKISQAPGKKKLWIAFLVFVPLIFVPYAASNIIMHVFPALGGFKGINLAYIGLFQLISVLGILHLALKYLGVSWRFIGVPEKPKASHIILGLAVGLTWAIIQFIWLFPATGGANRPDIAAILEAYDHSVAGVLGYAVLGVLGGGISEELYNRGFFINVLNGALGNTALSYVISVVLSVLFFAGGHLPDSPLMWLDIMVPTLAYTALFVTTKKVTASICAHALYNLLAVIGVWLMYGG